MGRGVATSSEKWRNEKGKERRARAKREEWREAGREGKGKEASECAQASSRFDSISSGWVVVVVVAKERRWRARSRAETKEARRGDGGWEKQKAGRQAGRQNP